MSWNTFEKKKIGKNEEFFRKALKYNPKCHLWHFFLGKKLRSVRRDKNYASVPWIEEEKSFIKAYELSKRPLYGTYVAQMYREKNNDAKALKIYKEILETKPEKTIILLRLALGFLKYEQYSLAKECLQKAQDKQIKRSMYNHYMGIYHFKQSNYEVSIIFFCLSTPFMYKLQVIYELKDKK